MTSPVEFDFKNSQWLMCFLYRTPDLGPLGKAEDQVTMVVDKPEVTVLSIGFEG